MFLFLKKSNLASFEFCLFSMQFIVLRPKPKTGRVPLPTVEQSTTIFFLKIYICNVGNGWLSHFYLVAGVFYRQISQMTPDFHRRSQRPFPIMALLVLCGAVVDWLLCLILLFLQPIISYSILLLSFCICMLYCLYSITF